jgi:hypothetical protein
MSHDSRSFSSRGSTPNSMLGNWVGVSDHALLRVAVALKPRFFQLSAAKCSVRSRNSPRSIKPFGTAALNLLQ